MLIVAASDLIIEALEELRAMTAGDTLDTTDGAKGLSGLNRLIDTTNIGRGNIFTERQDTYTLTIGKQSYSIGVDPAGVLTPDLTGARPTHLTRANLLLTSGSDTVYRKIDILTREQWRAKAVRAVPGMPVEVYNDQANPFSTLWFYMTPDQAYQVELWSWQQFAQVAATTTKIVVPPGYYEFWLYSLAMRLAGPFGVTPKETTVQLWKDAREAVQIMNARSVRTRTNGDLDAGGDLYNWRSGESN